MVITDVTKNTPANIKYILEQSSLFLFVIVSGSVMLSFIAGDTLVYCLDKMECI